MTQSNALTWLECEWIPHTAFGSPVLGCTLFSRLVAELARRHGRSSVDAWLEGYVSGRPFLVVGDPRPKGYVPRPALAAHEFSGVSGIDAKALKSRRWVKERALQEPATAWLTHAVRDADLLEPASEGDASNKLALLTLDDRTGFSERFERNTHCSLFNYGRVRWVIDVLIDVSRIAPADVLTALSSLGMVGHGAQAARGLGKFSLGGYQVKRWRSQPGDLVFCFGTSVPPMVPKSQGYDFARYRPRVIRGWSGPSTAHDRIDHAKLPMLVAEAGALFHTGPVAATNFFGRGLGGPGEPLSRVDPSAVAQGYAPALWVALKQVASTSATRSATA